MANHDLTGKWIGFYLQRNQAFGLSVEFLQTIEQLDGTMQDAQPVVEFSLSEASAEAGWEQETIEMILQNVREYFPEATESLIRCVTKLPEDANVEGWVKGRRVTFVKNYLGQTFNGFVVGEDVLGYEREPEPVHFEGDITQDGSAIVGRWWIENESDQGAKRYEGAFKLQRQTDELVPIIHMPANPELN